MGSKLWTAVRQPLYHNEVAEIQEIFQVIMLLSGQMIMGKLGRVITHEIEDIYIVTGPQA